VGRPCEPCGWRSGAHLFAGAGGWSTGLRLARYAGPAVDIEWDLPACLGSRSEATAGAREIALPCRAPGIRRAPSAMLRSGRGGKRLHLLADLDAAHELTSTSPPESLSGALPLASLPFALRPRRSPIDTVRTTEPSPWSC
jgi:hypothetical protein